MWTSSSHSGYGWFPWLIFEPQFLSILRGAGKHWRRSWYGRHGQWGALTNSFLPHILFQWFAGFLPRHVNLSGKQGDKSVLASPGIWAQHETGSGTQETV